MRDRLVELIEELEQAQADEDASGLQRAFWGLAEPLLLCGAVIPGTAIHHGGKSYWVVQRGDTLGMSICDEGRTPQAAPVEWLPWAMSRSVN